MELSNTIYFWKIEFCYPPFEGSVENSLPEEWINLPSLALPDGAHNTESENILEGDPIRNKDSYGFPLSIFTNGNLFHPYLSISYLDAIRSSSVRGFMVGATNALFVTKRDFLDAIVTVDEQGYGQVEIINSDLKRVLALTTADLRFGDYLLKNIEENMKSSAVYQGGDEWLRLQLRSYLLAMAATARSDLQTSVADFGVHFISSWRLTRNYRLWMAGQHEDVSSAAPGHAFAGQIGMYDVLLRMEHSVSGSEGARKAINAISSTGKNIGETGSKFKQSFSSWFKGEVSTDEHVLEDDVLRKELRYGISGSFPNLVAVGNTPSVVMTTTSELEIDQGTSSQMGESRGNILTSWIKTKGHDGEGLGAKVKNLSSWFKGGQNQNDEPNVLTENEIDVKNEQHFK
uniref:Avl9 domain-containing protein n=1 Tax=Heterorhabditis bacteriophora TaxID=37862 RepID=A0A1I7XAC7_HETBA